MHELLAAGRTVDEIAAVLQRQPTAIMSRLGRQEEGTAAFSEKLAPAPGPRVPKYYARIRRKYPRAYEPWTPDEDARLVKYVSEGSSSEDISAMLQRQPGEVLKRTKTTGVTPDFATKAREPRE